MNRNLHLIQFLLLALLASSCSKGEQQPPEGRKSIPFPEELTGEPLFNERCLTCHKVGEKGGTVGPDLSLVGAKRDARFLKQVIREPSKVFPGTVMPAFDSFSEKQVDSLADYLSTLK
ncbi:c-type cytochrome [Citrifermentans bremense]|uniref:c-type cytochrome n=1 Tax=Citrifermentans bremense TaxID=60035 RepID=UPI0004164CE3|nr:c-type cytochrome [Citrifermentans bremense]